jgi:TolB protein
MRERQGPRIQGFKGSSEPGFFAAYCLLPAACCFTVHRLLFTVCCFFIAVFLLFGSAVPSGARVYIDIDSPTIQKFPIAITDFRNLGKNADRGKLETWFPDALGKALQVTGFFTIIQKNAFLEDSRQAGMTADSIRFSDWTAIGAESLVKGGFQVNGNELIAEFRLFDVIQGKLLSGKRYTGKTENRKDMVLKFASEVLLQLTGEKGVFDTRIAFAGKKGQVSEIYTINFDGSDLTRLTNFRSLTLLPRWSPDGREMTFTSYRDGNPDLYLMDMSTGRARKISSFSGLNLAAPWSPDGSKFLMTLSKDGHQEIYEMDFRAGKARRLTHNFSVNISPTWSPDGKKIAFVSDRSGSPQIYVMDADGGNQKRLTYQGNYNTSPSWSPKGKKIAFEGMVSGSFQIFVMDEDGSNVAQLTTERGRSESPTWSPDGRYIAYAAKRNGRHQLCVMNTNGSNVRIVHQGMEGYANVSWSFHSNLY